MRLRSLVPWLVLPLGLAVARTASAETAFAPPGRGQAGLAVGVDAAGVLRARACTAAPCSVEGGVAIGVPAAFAARVNEARLAVVGIGAGRRAIVVTVPPASSGQAFEAIVAMPPGAREPRVLFAGPTGLVEGPDGVRQGKAVVIAEPDGSGARSIVVGEQRENLDLCGRPALLSPELVNPADMKLRPARMQRLSAAEREGAARLEATRVEDAAPRPTVGTLRALGASSAVGSPWALTDGDPSTVWAEGRGGSGRGEFVVMSAPADLPIAGFELVVQPPGGAPKASVPRELWLVTQKHVYSVTLPDAAASAPGARFRVTLPQPTDTDCVAVVVESAFAERADANVGIAELALVSEFEGSTPEALVAALAGGGERARAAGSVLRALGERGFEAVAAGYDGLDERGRSVALNVLDAAPCTVSAPIYVRAIASGTQAHALHASARLKRCAEAATEPLVRALEAASGESLVRLASELSTVAPDRLVTAILPRLDPKRKVERRALRVVLARAAAAPEATANVRAALVDPKLGPLPTLELLRALGPRATKFLPESGLALARLRGDAAFHTQYLVLGPAAVLAPHDAGARALFESALVDEKRPRIRTRALQVAPRTATYASAFQRALASPEVRVREAAAQAIGEAKLAPLSGALAAVVTKDDWPLVRRAAAQALGALPDDRSSRKVLLEAFEEDPSPVVRAAVADSLGARRSPGAAPLLRERVDDREEAPEVRRAAALSLGRLCDRDSVALLQTLARRVADPRGTADELALAEAALRALVQIGSDEAERAVASLLESDAKALVERAISSVPRTCRSSGSVPASPK
ncbi:MAG TPA: HEAT repeat domain-containing protein [Polyangiaceae bacterium]|nr:HEAT repeat domain-containing protein [Polyangiaceae bacterium]